jgi:hypothetical protein
VAFGEESVQAGKRKSDGLSSIYTKCTTQIWRFSNCVVVVLIGM